VKSKREIGDGQENRERTMCMSRSEVIKRGKGNSPSGRGTLPEDSGRLTKGRLFERPGGTGELEGVVTSPRVGGLLKQKRAS